VSEATTTTSLKAIFRFPFQSPKWQSHFIIGIALIWVGFLIPIVPGIFVYGYILRVMRGALDGDDLVLPVWEDWGRLALDGLRGTVIHLVYMFPATIVYFGGMAFYFLGTFYVSFLTSSTYEGGEAAAGLLPLMFLGSIAIMIFSMFIGSVLLLLGAIPLPMATAHFVAQDKLSAAFRVREWWSLLRVDKLGYFIGWVIVAGLMGILYFASILAYYSIVLCCFIPILMAPIGFYVSLVGAALFGQIYRESAATLASQAGAPEPSQADKA
jgi:hypothetical protein